jgi:hypothetical protein
MGSVVIHRYVKVGGDGVGRSKAHIRYIQHRRGDDKERVDDDAGVRRARRELFDGGRDSLERREINNLIERERPGGVAIHKLTLSPGVQGVDLREYTRQVMDEFGKEKGWDLQWAAAMHKNTDHDHIHVVILGSDANGQRIRIDKRDHDLLRYKSDQYLERERLYDRELDREFRGVAEVVREHGWDREGDRLGQLLGKNRDADRPEQEREVEDDRDKPVEVRCWDEAAGDSETVVYDQDSSLRELKRALEIEEQSSEKAIGEKEVERIKRWIEEKERAEEHERSQHKREDGERQEPDEDTDKPVEVRCWDEAAGDSETVVYDRESSLKELRRAVEIEESGSEKQLSAQELERLRGWIEEKELAGEREQATAAKKQAGRGEEKTALPKPEKWSKARALAEMPEWQKIAVQDQTYTRYSTQEELKKLDEHLKTHYDDRIDKQQYAMMQRWIEAKARNGDGCHARWDRRRFEKKQQEREQEGGQEFAQLTKERHEFEPAARKTYQDHDRLVDRRLPKQQHLFNERGRTLDYHVTYMNLMARQRLEQARERTRNPEKLKYIEQELALLKEYRMELVKDLPLIDLDKLYGKEEMNAERAKQDAKWQPEKPLNVDEIKFPDLLKEEPPAEGEKKEDQQKKGKDEREEEDEPKKMQGDETENERMQREKEGLTKEQYQKRKTETEKVIDEARLTGKEIEQKLKELQQDDDDRDRDDER